MKHVAKKQNRVLWRIAGVIWLIVAILLLRLLLTRPAPQVPENAIAPDVPGLGAEGTEQQADMTESMDRPGEAEQIKDLFSRYSDTGEQWSLYYRNLSTGEEAGLNEDQPMISASVIKLFVMAALYEQVEQGNLTEAMVSDDLRSMITISDNSATNRLLELLGNGDMQNGLHAVTDYAERNGYPAVSAQRIMLDNNGLQNYVSAADCGKLLQSIWEGTCVSERASEKMRIMLEAQEVNNRLPALLPEGTVIAHKTGDLSGICCADVGIIEAPQGSYILCCICNAPVSDYAAAQIIASISSNVYVITGEK